MERLKVGFDESSRRQLEEAAKRSGASLADEIRARVQQTFHADDIPPQNQALLNAILSLIDVVERQTGWPWHEHPFAHEVLRHAINSLLDREQPSETPAGKPPRKPEQIVPSKDPKMIGSGLEVHARSLPNPQFRPNASIGVSDRAAIRRLLEIQKEDEKANRKNRTRGKSGQQ